MSSLIETTTFDGETTPIEVPDTSVSFPKKVWGILSRIDVADNIETAEVKNTEGRVMYTYSYLSWSWAWTQLMKKFPESYFQIIPEDWLDNKTVMINTEVVVVEGESVLARRMWLPVMNPKNNSIQDPTSRQISDARMRCLVKNLAIHGLGLDLWSGSEIPVGTVDDPIGEAKLELLTGLYDQLYDQDQKGFLAWLEVKAISDITESQYQRARVQLERKVKAKSK